LPANEPGNHVAEEDMKDKVIEERHPNQKEEEVENKPSTTNATVRERALRHSDTAANSWGTQTNLDALRNLAHFRLKIRILTVASEASSLG
jgi:hypothetical protein